MAEKPFLYRLFTNGNFKVAREIFYVISFIVLATLYFADISGAVEKNTSNIQIHKEELQKLGEFKNETGKTLSTINANIQNIKEILEGRYNN